MLSGFNITSVSETIQKPPPVKAQTALKTKKIKYGEKRFLVWRMEFLHPAMWQVAPGWHATEFAQTSAILEFYIWFRFRPHHRSRHVILHQSAKFNPNRTTLGRKNDVMSIFKMAVPAILDFVGPIMGSLKSPCTTSYRSSIGTIALNCLVFEKIAFFCILATDRQKDRQTNRQTDRRTDGQHRCIKPLSLSQAAA